MNPPVSQRVTLSHRQVLAASTASKSRQLPPTWWYSAGLMLALCVAIWLGHLLAFWTVQQLSFAWMFAIGWTLSTVIPAYLALLAVALAGSLYNAVCRRTYLRHFERLNIPLEIQANYEILPEGLRLTTDRIEIFPRWAAVDTIERGKDGWIVSADQLTFLIPHADFESETTQKDFVAAMVSHLTDAARMRSAEAVAFAKKEAKTD